MSKPILQDDLVRDIQNLKTDVRDIKRRVSPGVGISTGRPQASAVVIGTQYYDTTLHKPIWSDGTTWRDAAGTVV